LHFVAVYYTINNNNTVTTTTNTMTMTLVAIATMCIKEGKKRQIVLKCCVLSSSVWIQTPGNYPEENIQHSQHGESLKSSFKMTCQQIPYHNPWTHIYVITTFHVMLLRYNIKSYWMPQSQLSSPQRFKIQIVLSETSLTKRGTMCAV
jgi:hypothetical protein